MVARSPWWQKARVVESMHALHPYHTARVHCTVTRVTKERGWLASIKQRVLPVWFLRASSAVNVLWQALLWDVNVFTQCAYTPWRFTHVLVSNLPVFFFPVFKIWSLFYTYSTSHCGSATFWMLNSHVWLWLPNDHTDIEVSEAGQRVWIFTPGH